MCLICLSALYGKLSRERPLHVAMVEKEAKRVRVVLWPQKNCTWDIPLVLLPWSFESDSSGAAIPVETPLAHSYRKKVYLWQMQALCCASWHFPEQMYHSPLKISRCVQMATTVRSHTNQGWICIWLKKCITFLARHTGRGIKNGKSTHSTIPEYYMSWIPDNLTNMHVKNAAHP